MKVERNKFSLYNLTHLVRVNVFPERESDDYSWYPAKYSWLFKNKTSEEGFYYYTKRYYSDLKSTSVEHLESDGFRVDQEAKIVYCLPKLVLYFTDKSSVEKYFKTYEELKDYLSNLKEEVDMVNLDYITQIK